MRSFDGKRCRLRSWYERTAGVPRIDSWVLPWFGCWARRDLVSCALMKESSTVFICLYELDMQVWYFTLFFSISIYIHIGLYDYFNLVYFSFEIITSRILVWEKIFALYWQIISFLTWTIIEKLKIYVEELINSKSLIFLRYE